MPVLRILHALSPVSGARSNGDYPKFRKCRLNWLQLMPSATTAPCPPSNTTTRPGASKRARLSDGSFATKANPEAAVVDDGEGPPAAPVAACKVPKFLRSLYAILQTEDPRIISWVQNKELAPKCVTAFQILEMHRFEREILPKYFKHQKFASFQRQLNNFGFRKWTKTQSSGVCTFSHNCFPPDLSMNKSNVSVRDQWRQKSTQVIPPSAASVTKQTKRRLDGNMGDETSGKPEPVEGADSSTRCRRALIVQARSCDTRDIFSHTEHKYYRSPNSSASMECSALLSHQPSLKKLARPNLSTKQDTFESLISLEAFCDDDAFKQFNLPPLPSHQYETECSKKATLLPSGSLTTFDFRFASPQALNQLSSDASFSSSELKPYDLKHAETPLPSFPQASGNLDTAALQGSFFETWMWDTQPSASTLEISSLELDCKNSFSSKSEAEWHEGPNVDNFQVPHESSIAAPKDRCQQNCGDSSTSGEFGLEHLLFVE
ncbi:hypothetical protein PsorP6_006944 [Peronosclerospora sorghi]|uniref:Uncharacterized protein n=1 Tax=Peronosclerospora sorghi TaxID=230839 RepID=A0ACC0WAU1_9STRA|nr:hypothetical protein PsorP6_006944 [Peronosclerospora sorghi]